MIVRRHTKLFTIALQAQILEFLYVDTVILRNIFLILYWQIYNSNLLRYVSSNMGTHKPTKQNRKKNKDIRKNKHIRYRSKAGLLI
jgi:hypothetical protein